MDGYTINTDRDASQVSSNKKKANETAFNESMSLAWAAVWSC